MAAAKKQEVATVEEAAVPALATTPSSDIGIEDVALPRLYIGQDMSEHVQEERVKRGELFTALGPDDPEPTVLESPVRVHILGMKKGKSIASDGELVTYAFNDPDAPEDAWVTYNYAVCLPEVDEDVPYKWLLTRTGKPTALQINSALMRNRALGNPDYAAAFELTTKQKENKKGKFFVPVVRPVAPDDKHIEIAERLAVMVSGFAAEQAPSTPQDEPDI